MADKEMYYERRQLIRRGEDFDELYADSGPRAEEDAPNNTSKVKFDAAIEQMGDDEMSEIRGFDRSRSGGFVNG
jgi:hypothetical protein